MKSKKYFIIISICSAVISLAIFGIGGFGTTVYISSLLGSILGIIGASMVVGIIITSISYLIKKKDKASFTESFFHVSSVVLVLLTIFSIIGKLSQ